MAKNIGTLVNSARSYAIRAKEERLISDWPEETASKAQESMARLVRESEARSSS